MAIISAKNEMALFRTGTSILRVTVLDYNDNPPTFTNLRGWNNPIMVKEGKCIHFFLEDECLVISW